MKELILEVGTPKGLYTEKIPINTKIEDIIKAVIEAMELDGGEPLELSHNGEILEPVNRPLNSFDLVCKIEMELVATGAGV
jgi:hypothetical protein